MVGEEKKNSSRFFMLRKEFCFFIFLLLAVVFSAEKELKISSGCSSSFHPPHSSTKN
jgi:hypothetical protein